MEKQLIEEISDGVATLPFNRSDRLNALSTPIMEGLLEALPRLALGCRRRKGLTTLLAERHALHLAGRAQTLQDARKPMHTDLLPFDLNVIGEHLSNGPSGCLSPFASTPNRKSGAAHASICDNSVVRAGIARVTCSSASRPR